MLYKVETRLADTKDYKTKNVELLEYIPQISPIFHIQPTLKTEPCDRLGASLMRKTFAQDLLPENFEIFDNTFLDATQSMILKQWLFYSAIVILFFGGIGCLVAGVVMTSTPLMVGGLGVICFTAFSGCFVKFETIQDPKIVQTNISATQMRVV